MPKKPTLDDLILRMLKFTRNTQRRGKPQSLLAFRRANVEIHATNGCVFWAYKHPHEVAWSCDGEQALIARNPSNQVVWEPAIFDRAEAMYVSTSFFGTSLSEIDIRTDTESRPLGTFFYEPVLKQLKPLRKQLALRKLTGTLLVGREGGIAFEAYSVHEDKLILTTPFEDSYKGAHKYSIALHDFFQTLDFFSQLECLTDPRHDGREFRVSRLPGTGYPRLKFDVVDDRTNFQFYMASK